MRKEVDITVEMDLAEAAAWLARLQGEGRTPQAEAAFKVWLAEPGHADAFARVTDTWDVVAGASVSKHEGWRWRPAAALAAGLATAIVLIAGAAVVLGPDTYKTAVGQQQTMTLSDGSRITLNTDSRVEVDYSKSERKVALERGEAFFEVAKNPSLPFIVTVGDEKVIALGTSFVVRRDAGRTLVTLVEGRVSVSPRRPGPRRQDHPTILTPGERLTLATQAPPSIDRPKMDAVVAWRRGEIFLDDVTLASAVAEINRYGGAPIEVRDARVGALRVSGVFKAQDPAEFAAVVSQLHGLRASRDGAVWVIDR